MYLTHPFLFVYSFFMLSASLSVSLLLSPAEIANESLRRFSLSLSLLAMLFRTLIFTIYFYLLKLWTVCYPFYISEGIRDIDRRWVTIFHPEIPYSSPLSYRKRTISYFT